MLTSKEIAEISLIVIIFVGSFILLFLSLFGYYNKINFNVDAISFYLLIWTIAISISVVLIIVYSDYSTYVCGPYGTLMKKSCDISEPNCFTDPRTRCGQESGFFIKTIDSNLYLTVGDNGVLYLTPLGQDDLYLRQVWLLYRGDGKPYFLNTNQNNRYQVIIKSLWNKNMCLSSGNSLVKCLTGKTLNYLEYGPYKDGMSLCLKYENNSVIREPCEHSETDRDHQSWEIIPVPN